jgi:hypothetical protein
MKLQHPLALRAEPSPTKVVKPLPRFGPRRRHARGVELLVLLSLAVQALVLYNLNEAVKAGGRVAILASLGLQCRLHALVNLLQVTRDLQLKRRIIRKRKNRLLETSAPYVIVLLLLHHP